MVNNEAAATSLILEAVGKIPRTELRREVDGRVYFRYLIDDGEYPGFDEQWREMSVTEQREHLRIGGKIAEWLKSMKKKSS